MGGFTFVPIFASKDTRIVYKGDITGVFQLFDALADGSNNTLLTGNATSGSIVSFQVDK